MKQAVTRNPTEPVYDTEGELRFPAVTIIMMVRLSITIRLPCKMNRLMRH